MEDREEQQIYTKKVDVDNILVQIGEFGRYQKFVLWLICLPACFPCGFGAFNQLFMADIPEHWCKVSELSNFTLEEQINLSIPRINNTFEKCHRYAVNWTQLIQDSEGFVQNIDVNKSWPIEDCKQGWIYNNTKIYSSIVIDFDLVCSKDIYPTLGLVALNLGGPVGVYIFGKLNDRIGRKKSFFLCLTTFLVGSILTCCAQNFWWWAGSRVIVGLTVPAIYQIPFIIALELVGPGYRSFVTVLTCIFYTFGLMMLAGITYLIQNWVYLGLATSLPFILYYLYWFYLPESPRWLLTKGRYEEASKMLETLAKVNKKELPKSFDQMLKQYIEHKQSIAKDGLTKLNPGCIDLCKTPNMRLKTSLITLNWFANETVYVGLSYYGPSLGSNEYLSFLLSSAVEIPSYLICWLIMDKWGRRWPLSLCMIISGVCCIITVLIPNEETQTTLILYLISKSAISGSFLIIYPFAGELYPTQLRGLGIGSSAYIGGLGLIIIPFITYLGSGMLILPLIIMGCLSVIGGILSLRLPETLHYNLPETVEEGEEFGKYFTMKDCLRCIPIKPVPSHLSYEDLEMIQVKSEVLEDTPYEPGPRCRLSMKKFIRQQSNMDTQKSSEDDTMQMTYWF